MDVLISPKSGVADSLNDRRSDELKDVEEVFRHPDRMIKPAPSVPHLIGGFVYTCMMTAALGAASWAFFAFMLSP